MYYPYHHGDAISKVQILENSIAQTTWIISTKKLQGGEKRGGGGTYRLKNLHKCVDPIWILM